MTFVPCLRCGRHAKAIERRCPFCGGACSSGPTRRPILGAPRRLKAIAVASTALGLAACSGGTPAEPGYGGVPIPEDAASDAAEAGKDVAVVDAPADVPMGQAAYGVVAPPLDGGTD